MTVITATATLPQRLLGKTGESVPLLGLGTAPGGMGMNDGDAIDLYEAAVDRGVTYIDTAPGYGRAHAQLGQVMARRRDEVFLVTKAPANGGDEAVAMLESNLRDLNTDAVDLCYVHCLGDLDVDRVLAPDGSLAGLRRAQRRGLTRYVGFTAHNRPAWAERALRQVEVDVVMLALNVADHHTYGFDRTVLPLAVDQNAGVAAMKVYGGAEAMKYQTTEGEVARPSALRARDPGFDHEAALRWALGLPGVSLAVVGMYSLDELERNLDWVRRWQPLAPAESARLLDQGRSVAEAWGPHYGPAA